MRYLTLLIQRLRLLVLVPLWPLVLLALHRLEAIPLTDWANVIDLATLALALSGGLIAAGFAQWRLTLAFLLVVAAGLGSRFPEWPWAATVLTVPVLATLPWFREGGWNGPASQWVGALMLVILALWWRGGEPARLVDNALRWSVSWQGQNWSPLSLLVAALLLAAGIRLLLRARATDLALAGAVAGLSPLLPQSGHLPATAATAAAVLALWTGLLLHAWSLAYRDELTELPNRRALDDALRSRPGHWSLGMLDVDHFKQFNDQWGHDVGDQVLRRVATELAAVGQRGRPFRYGGEEFAVVFPHDDLDRAAGALESVRATIASEPFRIRGQRGGTSERGKPGSAPEVNLTVSAGLTRGGSDAADTFKRADDALYKAKKKGRNRLVRAE